MFFYIKNQRGAYILLLPVFLLLFFIVFSVLLDVGVLYIQRTALQNTVDAAALAGANNSVTMTTANNNDGTSINAGRTVAMDRAKANTAATTVFTLNKEGSFLLKEATAVPIIQIVALTDSGTGNVNGGQCMVMYNVPAKSLLLGPLVQAVTGSMYVTPEVSARATAKKMVTINNDGTVVINKPVLTSNF